MVPIINPPFVDNSPHLSTSLLAVPGLDLPLLNRLRYNKKNLKDGLDALLLK
jgi:hypothetical protein